MAQVASSVGLVNSDELEINPATEEKQDEIIVALGGVNYDEVTDVNSGDSSLTYFGKAAIGSSFDEAVWQIYRVEDASSTNSIKRWADNDDEFNNIWDNRESLLYGPVGVNTWSYFSTAGANPQTWQDMETAGSFEQTWADLV